MQDTFASQTPQTPNSPSLEAMLLLLIRKDLERATHDSNDGEDNATSKSDRLVSRITKLSPFLSSVVLGLVALICTSAISCQQNAAVQSLERQKNEQTRLDELRRAETSRLEVLKSFMEPLSDTKTRSIALSTIASLGHPDIALSIALAYPDDGNSTVAAIAILKTHQERPALFTQALPNLKNSIAYIENVVAEYDTDIRGVSKLFEEMGNGNQVEVLSKLYDTLSIKEKDAIRLAPLSQLNDVVKTQYEKSLRENKVPHALISQLSKFINISADTITSTVIKRLIPIGRDDPTKVIAEWDRMLAALKPLEKYMNDSHFSAVRESKIKLEQIKTRYQNNDRTLDILIEAMEQYLKSSKAIKKSQDEWEIVKASLKQYIFEAEKYLAAAEKYLATKDKTQKPLVTKELNDTYEECDKHLMPYLEAEKFRIIHAMIYNFREILQAGHL